MVVRVALYAVIAMIPTMLFLVTLAAPPPEQHPRTAPPTPIADTIAQLRREQERAERARLNTALWVYGATASADWAVTAVCLKVPCGSTPQVGLFLHGIDEPRVSVPLGLAIDAAIAWSVREYVAPEHPRIALVLLYGLSGARVVVTATHINYLRRNAVRRPGAR